VTRPLALWTPPLRAGVSASRVAVSAGPWALLADFLAIRLPAGTNWPERLRRGEVLDAQGQALAADAPARPGQVLWYWRDPPPEPAPPEDIVLLHRCEHLVAVDKPHFMSATPGGRHLHQTVLVRLKRLLGLDTLVPMHRLDRETAGVLLFIVRPQDRHAYQTLLRDRSAHKVYEAVAPWRADRVFPLDCSDRLVEPPGEGFMQMQVQPGAPNAHTRIELVRRLGPCPPGWSAGAETAPEIAHYRLLPLTGRKHQLRMHLHGLGLPILGDRIYPRLWPEPAPADPPDWSCPLQLLAREIAFTDPVTGQPRRFVSRRQLALLAPAVGPVPEAPPAG
jgi:tRNA pseudouridine32 synthase/23S rRNA pseudouridine746 synthase